MRATITAAAMLIAASAAHAGSPEVQYGPAPSWAAPAPRPTEGPAPSGAPVRAVYFDQQTRLQPDGQEIYVAWRMKILSPEGLKLGDVVSTWNPDSDDLTVNTLRILRGGQVIDVLKTTKFRAVERDDESDVAVLNGARVARLHIPGLQVGDELEFAATVRRRDPVFRNRAGAGQLPVIGSPGAYRVRLLWPDAMKLNWKATPDLAPPAAADQGGRHELIWELRDPSSAIGADGAPARANLRRMVEFSEFSSWAEVSNTFASLVEAAQVLKPGSPVAAQADAIAKATPDPRARAEAALALVQDQIRYVYIGLDGGAYRPATAEETWTRRFGDCKAKTVLLLALLHRLGVQSEAVLVNSKGVDGTEQRLPSPAQFDHVLVRAVIDGKSYWLDGTLLGEHRLDALPAPAFRWALPVRSGPVELEAVRPEPPVLPLHSEVLEIDARAGLTSPAKVRLEELHRGEEAQAMKRQLSALSREDAERLLKTYFRSQNTWTEPAAASWRFDEAQNALILTMSGEGKPDWTGDDAQGRSLQLYGAGFSPPAEYKRPAEQDQVAPWMVDFPLFTRWTTVVRLPPAPKGWRWDYEEEPVHRRFGGVYYWREVEMKDGVLRSTMSKRALTPEISAAEAREVNAGLPSFDNKISTLSETKIEPGDDPAPAAGGPLDRVQGLDAQRRLTAALDAAQAGRLDEALADANAAQALEPESAAVLRTRADLLHRLGRHEAALADLEEARRIDPLDAAISTARAQELHELNRTDPATP